MDVGKVLSFALGGGIVAGILAGAAQPPQMKFAPLRPWQEKRAVPAPEPVAAGDLSAGYAIAGIPADLFTARPEQFGMAPRPVAPGLPAGRDNTREPTADGENDPPQAIPEIFGAEHVESDNPPDAGRDAELSGMPPDIGDEASAPQA